MLSKLLKKFRHKHRIFSTRNTDSNLISVFYKFILPNCLRKFAPDRFTELFNNTFFNILLFSAMTVSFPQNVQASYVEKNDIHLQYCTLHILLLPAYLLYKHSTPPVWQSTYTGLSLGISSLRLSTSCIGILIAPSTVPLQ